MNFHKIVFFFFFWLMNLSIMGMPQMLTLSFWCIYCLYKYRVVLIISTSTSHIFRVSCKFCYCIPLLCPHYSFYGLAAINHYTKFFNICLCLVAFSHNLKFLSSIAHEHTLKVWISLSLSLIICLYNDVKPVENSVNIIIVGCFKWLCITCGVYADNN